MAIVKQYHKETDTTYVYDSQSYWDAEKGQSRSKRRLIGKLDPVTGEIIPTGKRGRSKAEPKKATSDTDSYNEGNEADRKLILEQQMTIQALNAKIIALEQEIRKYQNALQKISQLADVTC
ncbi:MAG: hypothetical protein J6S50_03465 [Oscillospiraceae bacterium]|nr:hypothetical protein [Oscillospiraceae bacterium]